MIFSVVENSSSDNFSHNDEDEIIADAWHHYDKQQINKYREC